MSPGHFTNLIIVYIRYKLNTKKLHVQKKEEIVEIGQRVKEGKKTKTKNSGVVNVRFNQQVSLKIDLISVRF